jgi:hypothetical protein
MFIDLADRAEFRTPLGVPCALHSVVNSSRAIRSLLPEHCTPKGVRTFGTLENYKHGTRAPSKLDISDWVKVSIEKV